MTKHLRISDDLSIPADAVTKTFALLAVRGAGKSNAAAAMAEEMFAANLPFVAIDPVGSWWGLRSGRDGSRDGGLPIVIFGGEHGDIPLERGAGEYIAELVADRRLSCVLDVSEFPTEADKKRFLLDFARKLYLKNRDPLHLFLEEADDYIPQKPMGDEALLLRAWENIVRRGRSRGLGMTLITQRSAAVNKMVLTQVETLFVLRTTGPQDIKAIHEWVKYHQVDEKMLGSLASLADGDAWVWSPSYLHKIERIHFRQRETFDSGATPANLRGRDAKAVATLADVDLAAIRGQVEATIERAKADDPKTLRAEIARLKAEIAKAQKAKTPAVTPSPKRVEVPIITDAQLARLEKVYERIQAAWNESAMLNRGQELTREIAALLRDARAVKAQADAPTRPPQRMPPVRPPAPPRQAPVASARHASESNGDQRLGAGERATLIAIAQHANGVTREQITVLTGYKRSTRNTYLQRLGAAGFTATTFGNGDRILATETGVSWLGPDYEPLPTGNALRAHVLSTLPEGERAVLEILAEAFPDPVIREHLDEPTGFKRSTRNTYLQRLGARGLVEVVGDGVKASPMLFD